MLKRLSLTLLIVGAGLLTSRAETVEIDGVKYETNVSTKTASVTYGVLSTGGNPPQGNTEYYVGNVVIPETITVGDETYTVTSIGERAFRTCSKMTGIILPNTITTIGYCGFEHCTSLSEITLPESVKTISGWAFANCSSSLVVTMTAVESIEYNCFTNTTGATIIFKGLTPPQIASGCLGTGNNIIIPDEARTEYLTAFSGVNGKIWTEEEISQIPESTDTSKTDYVITTTAIANTSNLQRELYLDNSFGVNPCVKTLKVIGTINEYDLTTIRGLVNLTHLDLREASIEGNTIGEFKFQNCEKLESIVLPKDLVKIGHHAFYGCRTLKSVDGLESVEAIEYYAFYWCSSLEAVGDMPSLREIGNNAFEDCRLLQSIGDMPSLKTIGSSAFSQCEKLEAIGDLPSLTTIGSYAFSTSDSYSAKYCTSLRSIGEMPKLTSIGGYAFSNCSGLSDIYLPATISSVAVTAFSSPTIVHFVGTTPPSFTGTSIGTLICVPLDGLEAYSQALPDMLISNILIEGMTDFDVTVSARQNDSDILNKVNEGAEKDMAYNVLSLKVSGTINSYDIIVLRNKMLNLRKLDLSEATITASSYEYYAGCHTEDNVVGNNMFRDLKLKEIILPKNLVKIGNSAFEACNSLTSVKLPETLQTIGRAAFYYCLKLESIDFPASINSIGSSAFEGCSGLTTVTFPQELVSDNARIGDSAFKNCNTLGSITLPQGITTIEGNYNYYGAFYNCWALKSVVLPPSLESIPSGCFFECSSLTTVSIPPTLKSIGASAFSGCSALKEFRIPAGVNSIGNGAIPGTVKDVYTYTIQPTSIGQETFASDTYLTATLHVPETSESLYYWDTQWSQFQSIENFNEPYTYFYLQDKDLIEDPDTPRIEGETDEETGEKKNPDANLGKDSGLIVEGNDSQDLGNVDLEHDGKDTGTSIIGGNSSTSGSGANVNIDLLNIQIPIEANKWYFFAFPFDIQCSNIKFNGQFVWRYYDGELRAMEGSGAWKNLKDSKLERGRGYIFQGSKKGTLTLSVPDAHIDGNNWVQELKQYMSEYAQDASWNFIGNPFQSFYELADLGFDSPITWWNPNTRSYEALSPLDDDMTMYPFMAFFVQKPEGVDDVEFWSQYRETKNQKDDPNYRAAARKRRAARRAKLASNPRKLINLTVTDGSGSDRTRVVFNEQASAAYEVGVDASKFVSAEAPQLYSLDADQVRYAINERPTGDGVVRLGFYAPASGVFTIECTRTDCETTLKDCQTGRTITLSAGATYEFTADKGYDDTRFVLNAKSGEETSIEEVKEPAKATYYRINGVETDGSHKGLMIEVKGNEASKIIGK